jgi:hypothetical protein
MPTDGVRIGWCDEPLMPRSQQSYRPVLAVKLFGIMVSNRCRPSTFRTITAGDATGGVRVVNLGVFVLIAHLRIKE